MIELIPAIDIINGKCVRLSQGDYSTQKIYSNAPLDVAKAFEDVGISRLHLVDLDGAASKHIVNHRVLEQIATHTSLTIDFGGGIKSDDDLRIAFESGAAMVTGGSIAVSQPEVFERWIDKYGARIILGADVRGRNVAVNGWKDDAPCELFPFLDRYIARGISSVICTDIACDGMLQGPSIALYSEILQRHPNLHLIASGGVSSMADIEALQVAGIPAVIFGKAFYEGRISLADLQQFTH